MAMSVVGGPKEMRGSRNSKGHREWKVRWRLQSNTLLDGPAVAMQVMDLLYPLGAFWDVLADVDIWAWRRPDTEVDPVLTEEPNKFWDVTLHFSTEPIQKCQDLAPVTDPLLIPPEISGAFNKYTEEAVYDRFGNLICNSSWEQLRGPQVEFDHNRMSLRIKANYPFIDLGLLSSAVDSVNAFPIWGMPPRTVKLSSAPWQMKFYGLCEMYFEVTYEFDFKFDTWDKDLLDQGTRCLRGRWGTINGTGFTVNITASSGQVTGATIAAGGTGYPPNSYFSVPITGGGGTNAYVSVFTDATGVVTNATPPAVALPGSGYGAGGPFTTGTGDLVWIIATINGKLPNRFNPAHFVRYHGPDLNPTSVVLNGAGLPAGIIVAYNSESLGQVPIRSVTWFCSIVNSVGGTSLSDTTSWVPMLGLLPPNVPHVSTIPLNMTIPYGLTTVATDPNTGNPALWIVSDQNGANLLPGSGTSWTNIGALADWIAGSHIRGQFASANVYGLGDIVYSASATGTPFVTAGPFPPGRIHVEKYPEFDFLTLLGVPSYLPNIARSPLVDALLFSGFNPAAPII